MFKTALTAFDCMKSHKIACVMPKKH